MINKYRAWDVIVKTMVYSDKNQNLFCFGDDRWFCMYGDNYYVGSKISTDKEQDDILMRYTGLRDKNNVDIYENDIIDAFALLDDGVRYPRLTIVKWNDQLAYWYLEDIESGGEITIYSKQENDLNLYREVVGNTLENKELLEDIEDKKSNR